jgi:hypothetical protein
MITYQSTFGKFKGSSLSSPAHGWCGARATIKNVSAPPPSEKIRSVQQAGKKKKGCGENEFLPACSAPKARWGREAARPCVSKETKPAKIDSLIEKDFCARPLKNVSIFAGFARRQAASRWVGLARGARQLVQSKIGSREVYNYSTTTYFIGIDCSARRARGARLASQSKIRFCFCRKIPEFAPITL